MRRGAIVLAAVLVSVSAASARFEGNLNLFAGQKWLANSDWSPVETQSELGIELAFAEERSPVHFALDVFRSSDDGPSSAPDGTPIQGTTTEFAIGVRKLWGKGAFHPHLGAGGTAIQANMTTASAGGPVDTSDRGYGVWIDGGMIWRFARHLNLGLELRYSMAQVDLSPTFSTIDIKAGGFHAGALVGYGW